MVAVERGESALGKGEVRPSCRRRFSRQDQGSLAPARRLAVIVDHLGEVVVPVQRRRVPWKQETKEVCGNTYFYSYFLLPPVYRKNLFCGKLQGLERQPFILLVVVHHLVAPVLRRQRALKEETQKVFEKPYFGAKFRV